MRERSAVKVARSVLRRGNLRKGFPLFCVFMFEKLISLVIAPLLVGLVLLLVDRWLDD
ncbi:type I toxin-antitoxin system Fst family toxin [Enterococcus faecalis]|uniref:type I toxin-antitoxin system Fst family toxin n=1 Tax=Enterococcus faecalis TaxID=1351 RepID=UPI003CC6BA51